MKNLLINVGIFSLGVGVGVLASRTYFDKKYKAIADEEIESCRVVFAKRKEEKVEATSGYITEVEAPSFSTADSISYSDYYGKEEDKVANAKTLSPVEEEVYEISVEEYTEDNEYNKVTLNLYTEDGMLIYEEGEEIADESLIGVENIDDFSNTPFGQAYFRDPKNKVDYEIIKVDGSYQELIAGNV